MVVNLGREQVRMRKGLEQPFTISYWGERILGEEADLDQRGRGLDNGFCWRTGTECGQWYIGVGR